MLFKKTSEQKNKAIEKKLEKALSAQNNAQAMKIFASGLLFLFKEKMFDNAANRFYSIKQKMYIYTSAWPGWAKAFVLVLV